MKMENQESTKSTPPLTAYFLPYLTPSHFMPVVQMAQLFASRGVHVTILITHHNSLLFKDSITELADRGFQIHIHLLDFPSKQVGLPEGIESLSIATTKELAGKVIRAFMMLQKPMEDAVRAARPNFIVSDMHCFWASDLAHELGIPCLLFHARPFVGLCAIDAIYRYKPYESVTSDEDPFLLPGLPDPLQMYRSEMPDWIRTPNPYTHFVNKIMEGDKKSYGALVFSFNEVEQAYADHYTKTLGRQAWAIGPLPLHCATALPLAQAKKDEEQSKNPCLEWLDKMERDSVLYVSFGSLSRFTSDQLFEIAMGLESAGHPFIWVVRKSEGTEPGWLPDGFKTRIREQNLGMLIEGWAPQVKILDHTSTGGFMTHCGGNSITESVTSGVPMITWPLSADHFYHRKLVTEVAKIGVDVGNKKWGTMIEATDELVGRERIEWAVKELMGGGDEEAEERRRRARELSVAAKKTVQPGGSSYDNLTHVIDEIRRFTLSAQQS